MVTKRESRERAVAGYNTRGLRKCREWFREKCSHEGQHDEDYIWTPLLSSPAFQVAVLTSESSTTSC